MYYEINVAKDGKHFFATADRSLQTREEALEVYRMFKKIFPEKRGFEISVSRRVNSGDYVTAQFDHELNVQLKRKPKSTHGKRSK